MNKSGVREGCKVNKSGVRERCMKKSGVREGCKVNKSGVREGCKPDDGQNIQKIRSDFQAQVRIPDCPGPERVMSVVASDPDIVTSVLQSAIPYKYEQGEGADDGGERELRLLIHQ